MHGGGWGGPMSQVIANEIIPRGNYFRACTLYPQQLDEFPGFHPLRVYLSKLLQPPIISVTIFIVYSRSGSALKYLYLDTRSLQSPPMLKIVYILDCGFDLLSAGGLLALIRI